MHNEKCRIAPITKGQKHLNISLQNPTLIPHSQFRIQNSVIYLSLDLIFLFSIFGQ
jgi:hypothetical protein